MNNNKENQNNKENKENKNNNKNLYIWLLKQVS